MTLPESLPECDLDATPIPEADLPEPPEAIRDRPPGFKGKVPSRTTNALPGSAAKVDEMVRRAESGERLFDARDRQQDQGQAFDRFDELREGYEKLEGEKDGLGEGARRAVGDYKLHGDVRDKTGRGDVVLPSRMEPGETDPAHTLAARLRRLRAKKGWSLQQLARQTGLARSFLCRLENGTRTDPGLVALERLADAYAVSLDQLAGRADLPQ